MFIICHYCLLCAITGRDAPVADVASINFPAFWVVEEIVELRTQTSILRLRHPTTNHNNINTNTTPNPPLVIARRAVSEHSHHETIDMPPKKRSSGTPQKKEFKGSTKSESPDSSEYAVLSPER